MSQPATGPAEPLSRSALLLRVAILAALVTGGWALFRGPLAELMEPGELVRRLDAIGSSPWAPAAFLGLWLVVTPLAVPVTPLVIAGGAVFGVGLGSLYNFLGALGSATISYLLGRILGRDTVHRWIGERRLARVESFLAEHGFWTALRIRFVPIPFAAVNYSAAVVGMPFRAFISGTAIGIAGALTLYTYFSHLVVRATAAERGPVFRQLLLALGLLLLLTFAPALWRRLRGGRDAAIEPPEEEPGEGGEQP